MRKVSVSFILMVFGRGMAFAQVLLAMRLATALLEPIEMGRMNMLLSVISAFSTLFITPVGNYFLRQSVEWHAEGKLVQSLQSFAIFLLGIAIFSCISISIIHINIGIGIEINLICLVLLITLNLLLGTLNQSFINLLNILGFRWWYLILTNLNLWFGLGIAILLVIHWGKQAEYWMSGLLIAQVIMLFFSGIAIFKLVRRDRKISSGNTVGFNASSVFLFSWPLVITTGLYWMQTNGYRFVLVSFTDAATVGLFTTGLTLGAAPLKIFETLFTEYYQPIFYQAIAFGDIEQKIQAWNRYISAYFPAIVVMGTFIGFANPFLSRLLVSEKFYQVSWLSFWGALIQLVLMVYSAYVSLSFALLDTRQLILSNFCGALVAIVGTLLLASWNQMLGTAIALFLGMFATMLITALKIGSNLSLQLPWRRLRRAGILSLPLILEIEILRCLIPEPTFVQSIILLTITGLCMLLLQFILAREWMFSKHTIAKVHN